MGGDSLVVGKTLEEDLSLLRRSSAAALAPAKVAGYEG